MFQLDSNSIIWLTIIAAFSQSVVLGFTLFVFYKNLVVLKKHNEMTISRFTFQSNVEKYDLTLKFADWVKSEISDWIPSLRGDKPDDYLSKDEIKAHFVSIGKNLIILVDDKIVFQSLLQDEIKKLYSVLNDFDEEIPIVKALNKYLDIEPK